MFASLWDCAREADTRSCQTRYSYPGQSFTLASNEEATARQEGSACRLAIVRQAGANLEVAFVRDPANQLGSDPDSEGHLIPDVRIGEWAMAWNARSGVKLAPGIPRTSLWATDPNGIEQVGCIYTAQGFEFDYVGVIFGKDSLLKYAVPRVR